MTTEAAIAIFIVGMIGGVIRYRKTKRAEKAKQLGIPDPDAKWMEPHILTRTPGYQLGQVVKKWLRKVGARK